MCKFVFRRKIVLNSILGYYVSDGSNVLNLVMNNSIVLNDILTITTASLSIILNLVSVKVIDKLSKYQRK